MKEPGGARYGAGPERCETMGPPEVRPHTQTLLVVLLLVVLVTGALVAVRGLELGVSAARETTEQAPVYVAVDPTAPAVVVPDPPTPGTLRRPGSSTSSGPSAGAGDDALHRATPEGEGVAPGRSSRLRIGPLGGVGQDLDPPGVSGSDTTPGLMDSPGAPDGDPRGEVPVPAPRDRRPESVPPRRGLPDPAPSAVPSPAERVDPPAARRSPGMAVPERGPDRPLVPGPARDLTPRR